MHVKKSDNVGERLRRRRKELQLTLKEVAESTQLTSSFLSQVENNKVNLSLNSLHLIADALDVPVTYFMADEKFEELESTDNVESTRTRYNPVVNKDRRSKLVLPVSGVELELLVPSLGRNMVSFKGRLEPGMENIASRLREPTEEIIYVLTGTLLVDLDEGEYLVNRDESIYFEGQHLIRLVNVAEIETTWVSVITPAVF
ncbi:MAG: helix-turn-helix transcriptional regulator [Anaerolineaceae bacterium]|nr:helix-turn-helix transcriptional regulator [Anaerolineaceae bacterium]